MKNGDGIPGLVGWEWHGDPADIPGLEILARGELTSRGAKGTYTATIYPGPKNNFVFNAATIWWSDGLSAPPGYLHPSAHGARPMHQAAGNSPATVAGSDTPSLASRCNSQPQPVPSTMAPSPRRVGR